MTFRRTYFYAGGVVDGGALMIREVPSVWAVAVAVAVAVAKNRETEPLGRGWSSPTNPTISPSAPYIKISTIQYH